MAASPQFLITNKGLAVASTATPEGPYIHITGFKVGDAYGYEPTREDPGLNGNLLFEGTPTAYQNVGDNTMDIVCQLPADAGPFEFGEVGIYVTDTDGTEWLFAKAVWDTPQTKFSSLGTNVASTYTFHCLLKLQQSIAVFKIDTLARVSVIELDKWSDVIVPSVNANPDVPLTLVRELDAFGNSSLLHTSQPGEDKWTIGTNYEYLNETTTVNATLSSITVPNTAAAAWFYTPYENRKMVVEIVGMASPFRSVKTITASGNNLVLAFNPDDLPEIPPNGSKVILYAAVSYDRIALADYSTIGVVRAGDGIKVPTPGVFEVHGLLHDAPGTGTNIQAPTGLNSLTLPSGIYNTYSNSRVNNLPAATDAGGIIHISNILNGTTRLITQTFYPSPNSGSEPGNYVTWWRFFDDGNGGWSDWMSMGTSAGSGSWQTLNRLVPAPSRGICVINLPYSPKETNQIVSVSGSTIGAQFNRDSDKEFCTVFLEQGEAWNCTATSATGRFKPI